MMFHEWLNGFKNCKLIDRFDIKEKNNTFELYISFDRLMGVRKPDKVNVDFIYMNQDIIDGIIDFIREMLVNSFVKIIEDEEEDCYSCIEDKEAGCYPPDKYIWEVTMEKNYDSEKVLLQ